MGQQMAQLGLFADHLMQQRDSNPRRVAPDWELWRTLYRLSYSAAAKGLNLAIEILSERSVLRWHSYPKRIASLGCTSKNFVGGVGEAIHLFVCFTFLREKNYFWVVLCVGKEEIAEADSLSRISKVSGIFRPITSEPSKSHWLPFKTQLSC